MRKDTLSVQEAAEYLGVSSDTVYTMVKQKEIPHYRVRKRIFFSKERIDTWIDNQETQMEQEAM
ncbi:helix-turn-helix domain-containing protein [Bacillus infantis]|uniref:helix-turn-helix domain-containing protein n=1 Tax=Bacillus infantis TaxID=324767 RepID=UPI00344C7B3B